MKYLAAGLLILITQSALAEHEQTETGPLVEREQLSEPQKVYIESGNSTHWRTRGEEHCFYNKEHDHLHCYDEDITTSEPVLRVSSGHRHYQTRRYYYDRRDHYYARYNPISTGLAIGIGLGIPILLNQSFSHHRGHGSHHRRHGGHH